MELKLVQIAGYGPSVTYTPVANEFVIPNVTLTGLAYNLGAMVGAFFWYDYHGLIAFSVHDTNIKTGAQWQT
jgi:hypothetical protein